MEYIIKEEISVRDFLTKREGISNKMLRRLKARENGITVNGEHATVRRLLRVGDVLRIDMEETHESAKGCDIPTDIIYEDEYMIAVNKPANMPTHESQRHRGDTLANALTYYFREGGTPFVFRAINRLDRDTSGVVLVAKNAVSAARLSALVAERKIGKKYIACVTGEITSPGEIVKNIRRRGKSIIEREVCDESDGEFAHTKYRPLMHGENMSLLEIELLTGRTHQIRVHLSSIGHPIVGDTLYGTASPLISRQALHAHTLSFTHPFTGKPLTITAPLPDDISSIINN